MDLPPLNVNKFQASVDIIRYCEWPKIKKYMNKRIVKAVNECKTQATIAKKFVVQIEKKKWSLKKRSTSKGELEEKYDFDEDDISWGSDFDEDELDEDDVAPEDFDDNHCNHNAIDCRVGHYDLSQLNDKLTSGEQLLNVGRFERLGTPPNSLILEALHHQTGTNDLLESNNLNIKNLDANLADGNNSDGCTASISSSGVSSVFGTGSNDVSPNSSAYASACCSSSCNSSAADSTCSQSPPPLSIASSSSSANLACKLLAKLLANSNGLDNEHLSAKNLQLKMQLNAQLNKQFNKINEQNDRHSNMEQDANHKFNRIANYSLSHKSNSLSVINHNNNYLKNVEPYKPTPDFKSVLVNKSMINLSQYNQLNDYQFKAKESNLNDEIVAVKTNNQLGSPKSRLNNSLSNLSAFKSKGDLNTYAMGRSNKNSIVGRQIEQLEQLNQESNLSNASQSFKNMPDNEDGLSSGSSSILSTFKYNGSDKSYVTAKDSSSSSCCSSIRSISLKQLNRPVIPPKPNINAMKEDQVNRRKPSSKLILRPSIGPPLPPSNQANKANNCGLTSDCGEKRECLREDKEFKEHSIEECGEDESKEEMKSSYSSSHSLNELIISEFTIEEIGEILNCRLSDEEDNGLLNDTNYTRELIQRQQQFKNRTKGLQQLNEPDKCEQSNTTESSQMNEIGINEMKSISQDEAELNEKLMHAKNDLINNLANFDSTNHKSIDELASNPDSFENNLKSRFDHKFTNHIVDSKLDAECLNENVKLNLRKTGNERTKLGFCSKENLKQIVEDELDDYEKPICTGNEPTDECNYLSTNQINQAISPPPQFKTLDDHRTNVDVIDTQLKRQINLNKHLQSRWSSVDLVQQHQQSLNGRNYPITPLPPPAPFSSSSANKLNHSVLALSSRPKLPTSKHKLDFINSTSNRLTSAKKLPNKLKSLPDILASKLIQSNSQKVVSSTNKLIDDKSYNTFSSTSLLSQIKQTSNQVNQLAIRPLPPLPLEHFNWYHNLERDEATSLLIRHNQEGGYLVRTSKRAGCNSPYSLSIYHDGKCFNLNIRKRDDGLYALGKEKDKEKTFQSIPQLIEYHQTEAILLTTKGKNAGSTKLIASPSKF